MGEIIFITNNRADLNARSQAVLDVLLRLREVQKPSSSLTGGGESISPALETEKLVSALNRLHDEGCLIFNEVSDSEFEVIYIASREARDRVFASTPTAGWSEKILKRHRNAYRSSAGALFRFPFEDGEGYLQAFITDWSPFPAAAALAVHKDHPSVRRVARRPGSYFTGRFVRNPLTGDLMPVWITTWVKPEFGTGAVAVNPAHDKVDLNFAREVGLPIRFGLVRAQVTSDALTWPQPPVIKEGKTIKTGGWDGIGHDEALAKYFEILSESGYAERHLDRAVPGCRIASFRHSASGNARLCTQCRSLGKANEETGQPCQLCGAECAQGWLEGAEVLSSVLAMEKAVSLELLCPTAEIETTLLCARLLSADLFARPLEPQKVHLIQETEKTSIELLPEIACLAYLMAAPLDQIAVLKQPVHDQARLFLKRHEELLALFQEGAQASEAENTPFDKALIRVQAALVRWNTAEAFSTLYKLQKELSGNPRAAVSGALPRYFTLAFVLTGCSYPTQLHIADIWADIWNDLQSAAG